MNILRRAILAIWNDTPTTVAGLVSRGSKSIFINLNQSPKWTISNVIRVFHYAYMVAWFFRNFLAILTLFKRFKGFEKYDYLMEFFFEIKFHNALNCLCAMLLPLFVVYVDYVLYFKHYNYIWRLTEEVVLVEAPNFLRNNPQFVPKIELTKPIESIRSLKLVKSTFWNLPSTWRVHFNVDRLEYYPNMPAYLRVRAIFAHLVLNFFNTIAIVVLCIGMGECRLN